MNTYPLTPNRIINCGIEFKTNIVTSESGYEQRASFQANPKRRFRLIHSALNLNEQNLVVNFFIANKGQLTKFYFVNHIDGQTYTCRFADEKLSIDYINARFADISLEIVTC